MASITAVELGADTCAFARTNVIRGEVRLSAAEILDPAAFPGLEAFTMAIRQTRRSMRLSRRCRAVLWGLPEGASRRDATVLPLIEPLTKAGFKVERVVSPCNALAAIARLKTSRGEGSTCWIAINRGGVAIVVVRPGKQLYAHSFAWDSSVGATGSQARLLQRYSLVSFLSPEVKRAMAEARKFGTPVDAVVTCGNLPDLRSLTMPLIEELDVEVETLDSLEGLVVNPQSVEKLAEAAPAIRLACAAAVARGGRAWDESKRRSPSRGAGAYIRAAAVAAAVTGIGYLWYTRDPGMKPAPAPPVVRVPAAAPNSNPPAVSVSASTAKSTPPVTTLSPPAVSVPATPPKSNPPGVIVPPPAPKPTPAVRVPATPNAAAPRTSAPAIPWKPAVVTPPPSVPAKRPEPNPPAKPPVARPPAPVVNATNTVPRSPLQPLVTMPSPNTPAPSAPGRSAAAPAARVPPPAVSAPPPAPRPNPPAPRPNPPALNPPLLPADKPEAGSTSVSSPGRSPQAGAAARTPSPVVPAAPAASAAQRGPMPPLLKDAVPRVTAILVSRDRRFATIDGGQIIGIGDLLGRRTVVGMDERSVVLQEPSGVQIRIGLGGRLLGIERAAR